MKRLSPRIHHRTSVSLPIASYSRVAAGRRILARNGIHYSDQEMYRRLLKHILKNWRGRGGKAGRPRRYNADGKGYGIHALYINQVLYAALWQRALHSGESLSRMLDVAIRIYMPRLLEQLLRFPGREAASQMNAPYWARRYAIRIRQYPDCFINYACQTLENRAGNLQYVQSVQIISKSGLSPGEIWELMLTAA